MDELDKKFDKKLSSFKEIMNEIKAILVEKDKEMEEL